MIDHSYYYSMIVQNVPCHPLLEKLRLDQTMGGALGRTDDSADSSSLSGCSSEGGSYSPPLSSPTPPFTSSSSSLSSPSSPSPSSSNSDSAFHSTQRTLPRGIPTPVLSTAIGDSSQPLTDRMDELLLSSSLRRERTLDDPDGDVHELLTRASSISGGRGAPFIVLPKEHRFEKLRDKPRFAVDIGGTLVKLVYTSVTPSDEDGDYEVLLNFRKFGSIEQCIEFLKTTWKDRDSTCFLNGTGGGSFKYEERLQDELGVQVKRTDEMLSLITGCDFLLRNNEDESFTYHHEAEGLEKYQYKPVDSSAIYPFLLVNIGTGISVLKVDSPSTFTRVGGSTMGGGAFIGLGNLLTSAKSFDELLVLAEKGDHRQVDTLVSDIYGGDYENLGLRGDVIAGSFGKCSSLNIKKHRDSAERPKEEDVAKSLLLMISNTIGQMAILYGNRFNMRRIYFGGFFIRKHPISMRTLSYAINYWSKGECQALFLKHEGYLGAVGSFLDGIDEDVQNSSSNHL